MKEHNADNGSTGICAVEQISNYVEALDEDGFTTIAWAVTTGDFDVGAKEFAREKKIRLINGKELSSMLLDAGIAGIDGDEA